MQTFVRSRMVMPASSEVRKKTALGDLHWSSAVSSRITMRSCGHSSSRKWMTPLTKVVLPELVPPTTTMFCRASMASFSSGMTSGVITPCSRYSGRVMMRDAFFRMEKDAHGPTMGGYVPSKRDPSRGNSPSTTGLRALTVSSSALATRDRIRRLWACESSPTHF